MEAVALAALRKRRRDAEVERKNLANEVGNRVGEVVVSAINRAVARG